MKNFNSRILIIDDEEAIRRNVEFTLSPPKKETKALNAAAASLFDDEDDEGDELMSGAVHSDSFMNFDISSAATGKEAYALVEKHMQAEEPFAAIFCDMRMPGWDGLKTIEEIRKLDPRVEVVFLTAFSDHSIEEISNSVGVNISYMSKPFSKPDLKQMATRCVVEWNKSRELEDFVATLTNLRGSEADIQSVLNYIIGHLCQLLNTSSASIAEKQDDGKLVFKAGVGELAKQEVFDRFYQEFSDNDIPSKSVSVNGMRVVPIFSFGLALTLESGSRLSPDKQHLVQVFLEHASMALNNCRLQQELMNQQKMIEIGKTMSYVCHDLRGPIGQAETLIGMIRNPKFTRFSDEELYDKILTSLYQARGLADDILLFSRNNLQVEPSLQSLDEFLAHGQDYWEHLAQVYGVEFVINKDADFSLNVDGRRLIRALNNLIKNAMEVVTGKEQASVSLSISQEGSNALLSVCDNGSGIPEEVLPNLFKPFASAGKSHGTGFGLAITKQIVELHHGAIDVSSSPKGTVFQLIIPKAN